jgi:transglutaminase-like putative cysteine protease
MTILTVRHITTYRYKRSVSFGEHRMMLRPRESHDQRLLELRHEITPKPTNLRWIRDVFGSHVAIARFAGRAEALRFDSTIRLDHSPADIVDTDIEDFARTYPFIYGAGDKLDLVRLVERLYSDPDHQLDQWVHQFLRVVATSAQQHSIQDLPEEALTFLLGSRYCDTEKFSQAAWSLFGQTPSGWGRVQAICDFVHNHISFGYEHARATRTAWETFNERRGVCRDYAHLAIAFCRCMNIPARYCTGYLGDMGVPPPYGPMDFAAWFEAYVGGRWYTFDARNNVPRIGRVLMARGRDAIDVAISTTFGPNTLVGFKVWTDEVKSS